MRREERREAGRETESWFRRSGSGDSGEVRAALGWTGRRPIPLKQSELRSDWQAEACPAMLVARLHDGSKGLARPPRVPLTENCRHICINHGGEIESHQLGKSQAADHSQAEWFAGFAAGAPAERDGQAAEQFLTKSPEEREGLIRLVMEGHLRGIIGQLTVEEIVKQPEMVGERMRGTCADDMNKMGLEVISFTIKEVRDKNDYITNMGRPDIARIKRDADVATAEAERDTTIKRADASRESAIAKTNADQARVLAETLSQAKQAEAQRDLEVKKAEYLEMVKKQQAQADKTYEIQTNIMQQRVRAEEVTIHQVEKEHEALVQ